MALDGIGDDRRRDAQLGQFGIGHFDIDLFRLFADEFNFADVVDIHHHAAYLFGFLPQLFIRIAVAREGIDGAEDVVKAVVIIRSVDAVGQFTLDVFRQVSDFVPRIADAALRRLIVQIDVDDGLTRPGITFEVIEVRRILKFLFDLVGHLFFHLFCRSPRPGDGDDHGPHGICRVFHAAELDIGKDTGNGHEDDEIPD